MYMEMAIVASVLSNICFGAGIEAMERVRNGLRFWTELPSPVCISVVNPAE